MWKVILGFLALAGLALFVLMQGGEGFDMGGEQHGIEVPPPPPAASAPPAVAPASR